MQYIKQSIINLPISSLQTDSTQPRKSFDEEALQSLRESIRDKGILRALLVKKIPRRGDDHVYSIVDGERRFRAARGIGLEEVPCIEITDLSDMAILEVQLALDFTTEKFRSVERDDGIDRYYEMLMELPEDTRAALSKGDLTNGWIINYINARTHISPYVIRSSLDKRAFREKNEDFDQRMRNLIETSDQETMEKRYNAATEMTGRIAEFRANDKARKAVIEEYVKQSKSKGKNTIDVKGLEVELRKMIEDNDMSLSGIKRRIGTAKKNADLIMKVYNDKLNKLNVDLLLDLDSNKIKDIKDDLINDVVKMNKGVITHLKNI